MEAFLASRSVSEKDSARDLRFVVDNLSKDEICLEVSGRRVAALSGLLTAVSLAGFHPQQARCSFSRLCAVQTSAHSARTFSTPRNRNCRNPCPCLICPNTGSTMVFLRA